MAITRSTAVSNRTTGATTLTLSSVTVPAGSDRILEVAVGLSTSTSSVSSISFNGSEALSSVRVRTQSTGSQSRAEVWRLVAPTATTANVVITLASSSNIIATAQPWAGVNQTTPHSPTTAHRQGGTGITTWSDTGGNSVPWGGGDDVQVAWIFHRNDTIGWTTDAGVTERTNATAGGASTYMRIVQVTDQQDESGKVWGASASSVDGSVISYNLIAASAGGSSIAAIVSGYQQRGTI